MGGYKFLDDHRTVLHQGRPIILQPRQFAFALQLFRNLGGVVTRDWIWNLLWKDTPFRHGRALDTCVANLRKKLELREEKEFVLRSVYGRGYQLVSNNLRVLKAGAGSSWGDLAADPSRESALTVLE